MPTYPDPVDRSRRLLVALGLNVALVVAQVVAALSAHSVGLLADAGHNLSDVAALGVSLVAVRLVLRAPTRQRSYGYHRASILAAQANSAGILVVVALLAWEAAQRLGDPARVDGALVAVVAAVAMVVNLVSARVVHDHSGDLNMRGAVLHLLGDAAASGGVLVAGVVIALTGGWDWLDPAVSIGICALIAWRAVGLLRATADVLLEATPAHLDADDLRAAMLATPGVEAVHDLHVWSLSSELAALSAHLVVEGHPTLEEAQAVAGRVRGVLHARFAIDHATLELECESCAPADVDPCAIGSLESSGPPNHGHPHHH